MKEINFTKNVEYTTVYCKACNCWFTIYAPVPSCLFFLKVTFFFLQITLFAVRSENCEDYLKKVKTRPILLILYFKYLGATLDKVASSSSSKRYY